MVTSKTDPPLQSPLKMDSLTHIDLSTMSQSELHSLSLTSSAAFDLKNTDDVVVPKIDRSIFNESAGSRRQTYSRPRPAPRNSNSATTVPGHRRRFAGLLPAHKAPPVAADDLERSENKWIVNCLKHLISDADNSNSNANVVDSTSAPLVVAGNANAGGEPAEVERRAAVDAGEMQIVVSTGERKRKRGTKAGLGVHGVVEVGMSMEVVNKNGAAVDLDALADAEDPYGEELRRRTVGMESEAELLGFLNGLGGQWGSRRKKRKIVDACEFGDALPIGWKLLIGLKRKVGRVSLYCRRYISPCGQQYVSCKDVSLYLQSYFGLNEANQSMNSHGDNVLQDKLPSGNNVGPTHKDDTRKGSTSYSTLPGALTSNQYEKEITLLGIENLAEVEVHDIFECHKCNMIFDEKDAYLQHLLSSHQKTTRRYRLGTSVGHGVIVKDGRYECQFCHKVFNERRRYNGHVGIHVRNYVRSSEELPGQVGAQKSVSSPSRDKLPSRISKMDALIEIAQSSIREASTAELTHEKNKVNVVPTPDLPAAPSDDARNLGSRTNELEVDECMSDRTLSDPELNEHDSEHGMTDEEMEKIGDTGNVVGNFSDAATVLSASEKISNLCEMVDGDDGSAVNAEGSDQLGIAELRVSGTYLLAPTGDQKNCVDESNTNVISAETPVVNELEKYRNSELNIGFGGSDPEVNNEIVIQTSQKESEVNKLECGATDPSSLPSHCFPMMNSTPDKGGEFCGVDQKLDNEMEFEELRLDEIESFSFLNDAVVEEGFGASLQFESGEVMVNMGGRRQLTTVCVWCRLEFNHEAVDCETQSDSVGYMCPTCKAKISGQLNVLDSMNSDHF
ncbi:uncharacterized protein LOC131163774 [Malania oleifera]|uniref:uncharacterized protein LOC131163774 n=1 Tax=Malania oleifera TaxID=397392 RepID=UPI0025AEA5AD|nr:uncharacterized protein LOC131163774 [Malania oleifera]